jgi:hypothetical protein
MQPINLLAPEVRANPYLTYAQMRRHHPVTQVEPGGMWAVSRYDDVVSLMKNPQVFSSEGFGQAFQPEWLGSTRNPLSHSVVTVDPPVHTKLRELAGRAFSSSVVQGVEPHIRQTIDALIDGLVARGETDFMSGFAAPLPAAVIGHLTGLEPALYPHFRNWVEQMSAITPTPSKAEQESRIRILEHCVSALSAAVAKCRRTPTDDLLGQLIRAEIDGVHLTDTEVLDFLGTVLTGAIEPSTALLGNAMLFLSERPDVQEKLRADHRLIPAFIEELLRYEPSVQGVVRVTTAEVTLSGTTIPAGALVLALLASANRDEKRYSNPDEFVLERQQASVSFGHGIHSCIGAQLARVEARFALEALLTRLKRFTRLPKEITWAMSLVTRTPVELPFRFEA